MSKKLKSKSAVKYFSLFLVFALILSFTAPVFAGFSDTEEHWAQSQISKWTEKGLAAGYQDGTFKPDKTISRAEFITLVNRALGLSKTVKASFKDVSSSDWFAQEIAKAAANGYITGYEDGTMKPNQNITRQEVAVILYRLLSLKAEAGVDAVSKFKDAGQIPQWSKEAVNVVVNKKYFSGYPDGTFGATKNTTRAETIAVLDRVVGQRYSEAGTYGPASGKQTLSGNVTITAADVKLQNVAITGDLFLTAGIGDGNVYLDGVTVTGDTIIKGGGEQSIHIANSSLGNVVVDRSDGKVRVVASGSTNIRVVRVDSAANLVEEDVDEDGDGFVTVYIEGDEEVELEGTFGTVSVESEGAQVNLTAGVVENIAVNGAGTTVNIAPAATVNNLFVNTSAAITGEGRVVKAVVVETAAPTVTFEKAPEKKEQVAAPVTPPPVGTSPVTPPPKSGGSSPAVTIKEISDQTVGKGKTLDILVNVSPDDVEISAESSDTSVATVTVTDYTITITGVNTGTAEVTVTGTKSGFITATKKFTVTVTYTAVSGVSLNVKTAHLAQNDTLQLTATVLPAGATNKNVTWTSGDESVATVSNTGLVTVVADTGTAVITATSVDNNTKKATATIKAYADQAAADTGAVADVKAELTTATLNPVEGTDNNVVPLAQAIANTVSTGVTIAYDSSANSQVGASGAITYGMTQVTGDVTFSITKGAATDTQAVSVVVPQSANAAAVTAAKNAVGALNPVAGTDTSIVTMAQATVNAAPGATGVTVSIVSSANANVNGDNGVITYSNAVVSGNVELRFTKGSASDTKTVVVNVPKSQASVALENEITAAQALHDGAVEGTDPGEYAPGSKATFQTAITNAITVRDNAAATQAEVATARDDLAAARTAFEAAQVETGAAITGIGTVATVLQMGETETRTAATTESGTITWSSTDPGVATINADTGEVTAVSAGTTTIKYMSTNGKGNLITITVYAAASIDNPTIGTVRVGSPNVTPTDFTNAGAGQTITWMSSDASKATINASTGEITAVAEGDTTISYRVIENATGKVVVKGEAAITVLPELIAYNVQVTLLMDLMGTKLSEVVVGSVAGQTADYTHSLAFGANETPQVSIGTPMELGGTDHLILKVYDSGVLIGSGTITFPAIGFSAQNDTFTIDELSLN